MFECKFSVSPADAAGAVGAVGAVNWLRLIPLLVKYGPLVAQLVQQVLADLSVPAPKTGGAPGGPPAA